MAAVSITWATSHRDDQAEWAPSLSIAWSALMVLPYQAETAARRAGDETHNSIAPSNKTFGLPEALMLRETWLLSEICEGNAQCLGRERSQTRGGWVGKVKLGWVSHHRPPECGRRCTSLPTSEAAGWRLREPGDQKNERDDGKNKGRSKGTFKQGRLLYG